MFKKIIALLATLALIFALTACGNKTADDGGQNTEGGGAKDYLQGSGTAPIAPTGEQGGIREDDKAGANSPLTNGAKLVYKAELSIEALKYDEAEQKVMQAIDACGGYVEKSSVSGGQTYYDGIKNRQAYFTIRVPVANYAQFMQTVAESGNVVNNTQYITDITLQYVDNEARLTSLKMQEERLLVLYARADTVEEIMQVEQSLQNVRYQIESAQSTKNVYDNQVDYATINLSLYEVRDITAPQNTFFDRIAAAFKGSLRGIANFFQQAVIFIIYALPYMAVAAVLLLVARYIVKKRRS